MCFPSHTELPLNRQGMSDMWTVRGGSEQLLWKKRKKKRSRNNRGGNGDLRRVYFRHSTVQGPKSHSELTRPRLQGALNYKAATETLWKSTYCWPLRNFRIDWVCALLGGKRRNMSKTHPQGHFSQKHIPQDPLRDCQKTARRHIKRKPQTHKVKHQTHRGFLYLH